MTSPNMLQGIAILVTAPIRSGVTEALEATFTVHRLWEQDDPDAFFAAHGAQIRGIATTTLFGKVRADLIERLPALEIIASFGVGYDNVDVAAAVRAGAIVTNTPGVLVDETADLAMGLLLATIRQIPQAERHLRTGLWPQERFSLSPRCAAGAWASWGWARSARRSHGGWKGSAWKSPTTDAPGRTAWITPGIPMPARWRRPATC